MNIGCDRLEKRRAAARAYCATHREARREHNRNWIANNRDRYNAAKARYRLKLKKEIMSLYSNPVKCTFCGFNKIDCLVLDHINNDGSSHRKQAGISHRGSSVSGTTIYEWIRKNGKADGLQVLCANCNTIKQLRYGRQKNIKDLKILEEINKLYENTDT